MLSLDEFQIIESEQEDILEAEVPDTQVADVSSQGVASIVDVSWPGRRVSKRTRTSPSSREKGRNKSRKESTSVAAPSTPTVQEEEIDTASGDDDYEE